MVNIKICGIKTPENALQVSSLLPDYLGFIFHEPSKRYVGQLRDCKWIKELNITQKKIGVFVDQDSSQVIETASVLSLSGIQLHGNESYQYCEQIKESLPGITIWKVFSPSTEFNFTHLERYYKSCALFLFDTLGGGSGKTFDWSTIKKYKGRIPFGVAGGIGSDNIEELMRYFVYTSAFQLVDINSKVEDSTGLKSPDLVRAAIESVRSFKK